jgi:AcrR family transcriptional regulator
MSKNSPSSPDSIDQRVRRTRDRLGDAIIELVQEKPFDSITVQEVLDRAEVGRSTFYLHYRDKNDLFVSDVDEFLGLFASMLSRHGESSDRVAPVREFFAHVADARRLYDAMVAAGKLPDFTELAQAHFARSIEARLIEIPRARGIDAEERVVLAQAAAGAMLSLLTWWLRQATRPTPEMMDDRFHALVWNGVHAPASERAEC